MYLELPRAKPRSWRLTAIYRLAGLLGRVIPRTALMRLFLDLEWIFARLSHELSHRIYDTPKHPMRRLAIAFIGGHLDANATILDLGCGFGDLSDMLAARAREVVGIDHSEMAIASARNTYRRPNLSFESGDAVAYLEASPRRFDVLILSHVLEHLADPGPFLKAFRDHFSHIYIEVPDFEASFQNTYRHDFGAKLIYSDNDHVTEFDRAELQRVVGEAGLRIEASDFRYGVMRLWCATR